MLVGYMRVSTDGDRQVMDLQRDALLAAGVDERHLYEDRASGNRGDRAGLAKALGFLRPGDCLVVWKLDRLGRSLPHLLTTVTDLKARGVAFRSLTEQMDTTTAQGELVFHIFGALAQFERSLIQERVQAGLAAAARFRISVAEAEALMRPEEFDAYENIGEHYAGIRRWSPAFLDAFAFEGVPAAASLLRAIEVLREANRKGSAALPKTAPTGFIRQRWASLVLPGGAIDRRHYELCVLSELRGRVQAGDVWVTGSRRYRSFEERLISEDTLNQLQQAGTLPIAVEPEFELFIAGRHTLLDARLAGIAPEKLLRALLLQAFYSVRSERQLMEQIGYNLLFRWFVGLAMDAPVWDATTFSKNRDRLLDGDVAQLLLAAVLAQPRVRALMSDEHFSVDGTLIQAWASHKSFQPKPGSDAGAPPPADPAPPAGRCQWRS